MKIKELYKDSSYEIQLKAPLLNVMILGLMGALGLAVLNNVISKNVLFIVFLSTEIVILFFSLRFLNRGEYHKSTTLSVFSLLAILTMALFLGKTAGEQHFAILSLVGILIFTITVIFISTKKQTFLVLSIYSIFFLIDILKRVFTGDFTVLTRTLIQQLIAPVSVYILVILLLYKFKNIVALAISDSLIKSEESMKKGEKLKELISNYGSQLDNTRGMKKNIEETSGTVKTIDENVNTVTNQVGQIGDQFETSQSSLFQIAQNVGKLDDIASSQASTITETSAALEEMVASIKNVTAIINNKTRSVAKLKDTANNGVKVITKTKDSFKDVTEHIESIKSMTTSISKISSQTNLLAMNAAIEAAHAGESGKGFAVVADEVRKLAESSSVSVKQISITIKDLIDSIHLTDENVRSSGDAFASIGQEVEDVDLAMHEINTSVNELSIGSDEILTSTSLLNDLTIQVSEAVKEVQNDDDTISENISNLGKFIMSLTGSLNEITTSNKIIDDEMNKLNTMSDSLENFSKGFEEELKSI